MSKSLLIVESPAKARTIGKYLGKDVEVKATVGHIKDLPVNKLGVDLENGFQPEYVTIDGKQKIISELKKAAKGKERIFLAPDPDREGEAIAWHIANELKDKGKLFSRVLFHELTPHAIRQALEKPEDLSVQRFESQQARRILDRIVGYLISPILWEKVKRGLSAGRVQSVALRIIADREREIFAFTPEEYWSLTALLTTGEESFSARLLKVNGKKADLKTEEQTKKIMDEVVNGPFVVRKVVSKQRKRQPVPAFTTSQLQQAAYSRLKLSTSQTMRLAQQLYEGLDLGSEGSVGLITYMRTDSVRVAEVALEEARELIKEKFGPEYLPKKAVYYKNKKGSQDAHEAIRPTSSARTPEQVKEFLSGKIYDLYELIWRRFVASQMEPALIDQTTVDIEAGAHEFRATGSVIRFKGFLLVYDSGGQDEREVLPPLTQDQEVKLDQLTPKQHFTQPPPRFTEATLVKELEENGIGRPSTYASIISTLKDKAYVEANKGQLRPTELGFIVSDLLVDNFPRIMDVEFTAGMENSLDEIEEGRAQWKDVLSRFYDPFEQNVEKAKDNMLSLKREGLKTDVTCDECGAHMVLKYGRNGPFLSCSQYPECKNALDFTRDENGRMQPVKEQDVETGETCDKCGLPLVLKKGKYGPFLACSGYPDCKNTKPLAANGQSEDLTLPPNMDKTCEKCGAELKVKRSRQGSLFIACSNYPKCKNAKPYPTGVKCIKENCDGELVERASRRGIFYGCTNYPKCRVTLRNRPLNQPCPQCGANYLLETAAKSESEDQGVILKCPNKECGYTIRKEDKKE